MFFVGVAINFSEVIIMKTNPIRYSSAVGEVWIMMTLKTRYCHNVFDKEVVRIFTNAMLIEAMARYEIRWQKIGFDNNHVHIIANLVNYGTIARFASIVNCIYESSLIYAIYYNQCFV